MRSSRVSMSACIRSRRKLSLRGLLMSSRTALISSRTRINCLVLPSSPQPRLQLFQDFINKFIRNICHSRDYE